MRRALTPSESALWQRIKCGQLGLRFARQAPLLGKYIADFFAPSARLVVEVDGAAHAGRAAQDARRDAHLGKAGYQVLRLPAELVLNDLPAAIEQVKRALR